MSDFWSAGMSGLLSSDGKNVPQSLRQRLALAMLLQKQQYPKTFGEGLSSIGDSISQAMMARGVMGDAADAERFSAASEERLRGGGGPVASAAAPGIAPPPLNGPPLVTPAPLVAPSADAAATNTPPLRAARPAMAVPPDEQQSYEPGAPVRLSSPETLTDWRQQNPLPPGIPPLRPPQPAAAAPPAGPAPVPPMQPPTPAALPPAPVDPATPFEGNASRFNAAFPNRQQTPPIMASGGNGIGPASAATPEQIGAGRNALAAGLLARQQGLQPQGAPPVAPPAPPPPQPVINAAPPPAPPAPPQAAPPRPAPDPGYIPTLGPAPTPPPTQTQKMIDIENEIRRAPPGYKDTLRERLTPLYENEKAKLGQQQTIYADTLKRHHEREKLVEEATISARKRVDEANEAAQRIAKGNIPDVKQDVETGHTYNANTGQWEAAKIAGADPNRKPVFKGTEFQGKALVNYGRARLAHEDLVAEEGKGEKTLSSSPLQSAISSLPLAPKSIRSEDYKEADTAADNFVQAFIRQQSGGAYTDAELEKEARAMLPRYGDTDKQLAGKREQRSQFLSGLHSIIGSSGQKIIDIDAAERERMRTERAAKKGDTKAADPLEGREALFPDKTIRVRRNGEWVPK